MEACRLSSKKCPSAASSISKLIQKAAKLGYFELALNTSLYSIGENGKYSRTRSPRVHVVFKAELCEICKSIGENKPAQCLEVCKPVELDQLIIPEIDL